MTKEHNSVSGNMSRNRFSLLLAVIAFLASVSIMIYVISILADRKTDSRRKAEEKGNFICLKCQTLSNDTAVLSTLSTYFENGNKMCCAQSVGQLSTVLEMVNKRPRTVSNSVSQVVFDGAADLTGTSAHKRLLPPVPAVNNAGMLPHFKNDSNVRLTLDATYNKPLIEHYQNVEVLPTGLHILQSGLYHVYSSVYFNPDSDKPCAEYQFKTWHHGVVRSSPNAMQSSGTILQSVHTCCDTCIRDKETSYTAGVFDLRAGDHLHVEVSGYGLISFHKESSYLGLVMLGAEEKI